MRRAEAARCGRPLAADQGGTASRGDMATAKKMSRESAPAPARMRQLYRRLSQAGFGPKFVRDYVLPPAWQDEMADRDVEYQSLLAFLSRHLGIDTASLQDPAAPLTSRRVTGASVPWPRLFEEADATQQLAQGVARVALSGPAREGPGLCASCAGATRRVDAGGQAVGGVPGSSVLLLADPHPCPACGASAGQFGKAQGDRRRGRRYACHRPVPAARFPGPAPRGARARDRTPDQRGRGPDGPAGDDRGAGPAHGTGGGGGGPVRHATHHRRSGSHPRHAAVSAHTGPRGRDLSTCSSSEHRSRLPYPPAGGCDGQVAGGQRRSSGD